VVVRIVIVKGVVGFSPHPVFRLAGRDVNEVRLEIVDSSPVKIQWDERKLDMGSIIHIIIPLDQSMGVLQFVTSRNIH
jgi:hypothetical protein